MDVSSQPPAIQARLFHPGMRVSIACSGGADSVALLRTLLEQSRRLGLTLSVIHMNHGIRGEESDSDEAFVRNLAAQFDLPVQTRSVNTPAIALANGEGLEEAARNLRYSWFWELLTAGHADAVVTAHTLDDQAETVAHRLLRGAWTEGLSGIHPVLKPPARHSSQILRPFLTTTRAEIEAWLRAIGQTWREDASNRDVAFTRNRIRHELLPVLAGYNPGIKKQFAQLAALALDEESYWQAELARLLPSLLLPGKAVRGGGRSTGTLPGKQSLSIEVERLRALHPAMRRRVLRAAAAQLGVSLDFDHTDRLLALARLAERNPEESSKHNSRLQLSNGLRAERTARELRILIDTPAPSTQAGSSEVQYTVAIPGVTDAPGFGLRIEASIGNPAASALPPGILRCQRPGDRVLLRYSRSLLKISDALRRARLPATGARPLLEWQGEIVWVAGLTLESAAAREASLVLSVTPLD